MVINKKGTQTKKLKTQLAKGAAEWSKRPRNKKSEGQEQIQKSTNTLMLLACVIGDTEKKQEKTERDKANIG